MDSIAKTPAKSKGGKRWIVADKCAREYRLIRGDLGEQVKRTPLKVWGGSRSLPCGKRKRGDITGFSEHSRSRLRVTLATACWRGVGSVRRLGLTLTLPWAASPDKWRTVWHDFVVRFARHCKAASLVWRIELTTGQAETSGGVRRCHVHAVAWLPVDAPLSADFSAVWDGLDLATRSNLNARHLAGVWIESWKRYSPALTRSQWEYSTAIGFGRGHGIVLKWLDDTPAGAIHYLCDHASKHKEDQLGWIGRQWGVVNRRNLEWPRDGELIDGREWVAVERQLRRYNDKQRRLNLADERRLGRDLPPMLRRYYVPCAANKCWFGATRRTLDALLSAARAGRIALIEAARL